MKPMVYKPDRVLDLLHFGVYREKCYMIVSMGTHPNAYVICRKGEKYYNEEYGEIDLFKVEINYARSIEDVKELGMEFDLFLINNQIKPDDWVIGWDYGHSGDYNGHYGSFYEGYEGKKWTTEEIDREVKFVIDEILDGELRNE